MAVWLISEVCRVQQGVWMYAHCTRSLLSALRLALTAGAAASAPVAGSAHSCEFGAQNQATKLNQLPVFQILSNRYRVLLHDNYVHLLTIHLGNYVDCFIAT